MTVDPMAASERATPLKLDDDQGARAAWKALLGAMDAATTRVYSEEMGLDEVDRAEGMRFLMQTFSLAAEIHIEKGNPREPAFTNWMASGRKVLGDNPDARYDSAPVSPDYTYEVTGTLSHAEAQTFTVYGREENGWNNYTSELTLDDVELEEDGSFSVILSRTRPEGVKNWIELNETAHMFLMRQFFNDTPIEKRPRNFEIRRIGAPDAPETYTEAEFAKRTQAAADFFSITVDATFGLAQMRSDPANSLEPPSTFDPAIVGIYYPSAYNAYFGAWFDLAEDEALIVEGTALNGRYAIIHTMNGWLQSIEGPGGNQRLNKSNLVTDADGNWKVVVSNKRPANVENWLSTHGHRCGHFTLRIVHPEGEGTTRPVARAVKLNTV